MLQIVRKYTTTQALHFSVCRYRSAWCWFSSFASHLGLACSVGWRLTIIGLQPSPKNEQKSSAIADGPRDASCQLKSCQLPRNSAETTCTTSPEQSEVMKLEGYGGAMCNKHVHSTLTRSSHFHCPTGVINKPSTDKLLIYRRLAVAKFSKSTM